MAGSIGFGEIQFGQRGCGAGTDDALYQAKHAGRDRVVGARPAAALPELNFTEAD